MDGAQQLDLFRHVADMAATAITLPFVIWGAVRVLELLWKR